MFTPWKVLPNGNGLVQQDNASCKWFVKQGKKFKLLTTPTNSPDLKLIKHLWDVLEKKNQSNPCMPSWMINYIWG